MILAWKSVFSTTPPLTECYVIDDIPLLTPAESGVFYCLDAVGCPVVWWVNPNMSMSMSVDGCMSLFFLVGKNGFAEFWFGV